VQKNPVTRTRRKVAAFQKMSRGVRESGLLIERSACHMVNFSVVKYEKGENGLPKIVEK
jgi:hypothetical protein